jgi:primosomal protein N' (replication factor Y)
MFQYADVVVPLNLNQVFSYSIPETVENIQIGTRVIVSFGIRKYYTAVVVKIHNNIPDYPTKDIDSVLDDSPIITQEQIKLWFWMSEYYMCSVGNIMSASLPTALKLESTTELIVNEEDYDSSLLSDLNSESQKVFSLLQNKKTLKLSEINSVHFQNIDSVIRPLISKGFVKIQEKVYSKFHSKKEYFIKLVSNVKLHRFAELNKRAKKQIEALKVIIELNNFGVVKKSNLVKNYNITNTSLNGLVNKGIIVIEEKEVSRFETDEVKKTEINSLSEAQEKALTEILLSFIHRNTCLLHGVTSSGKTEVFIHLIKKILDEGKQVLYMLPEIAITTQIVSRLKKAFGDVVCVYHSRLNANERAELWQDIFKNEKYKIILGVRSSIFLPYKNLGLIVVDEEHETSYKQYSSTPYYHARDCAIVLASLFGAKTLLATATPSIESYYNTQKGKYALVQLIQRYRNFKLPEVEIVDRLHEYKKKAMVSMFTPQLYSSINNALNNGEQVILFQNRRGFSPYIQCEDCGEVVKCKHCDVSLTYHKHQNILVCHYCSYTIGNKNICTSCGSMNLKTKGYGTEKVESEIKLVFPNAKIQRLDLDSTRTKNSHEEILSKFENKELDILVGTQMVTKGLDFSNVSVVGILDADALLNFPDYKALERSFQLMVQVSGRAGRATGKGKVIIQTNAHNHKILSFVKNTNYDAMYRNQLQERRDFMYPPVINLIKIALKHKKEDVCSEFSNLLSIKLREMFGARVLGPEIPVINRIQTYFIRNIYIKLEKNQNNAIFKKQILNVCDDMKSKHAKSIQIIFDVDPV